MDEIQESIKQLIISDKNELTIDKMLNNEQRAIIHEFCKTLNLVSKSHIANNNKYMIIKKIQNNENLQELVDLFNFWSNIPIPAPDIKYFDYYCEILDKYYGIKDLYKLFLKGIKDNDIYKLKGTFNSLIDKINILIKEKPDYKNFLDINPIIPDTKKSANLYQPDNHNKYFVSIDIKSANFTIIRHFFPSIFDNKENWQSFIQQYTDIEFLHTCKYFREVLFGKSGLTKKISNLLPIITKFALTIVDENKYDMKLFSCEADEIIYEVKHDFDIENFRKIVDNKHKNYFHVKMFKLIKLGNKPFYVKEYPDKKIEFKKCPKKYLMQCIKYYEGIPLEINDLKFLIEGDTVTFDNPIVF